MPTYPSHLLNTFPKPKAWRFLEKKLRKAYVDQEVKREQIIYRDKLKEHKERFESMFRIFMAMPKMKQLYKIFNN